jgi:hypothetical protein
MTDVRAFTVHGTRWTVEPRAKSNVRALDEAELFPSSEQHGLFFQAETGEQRFFPWERPAVLRPESLHRLSDTALRDLLSAAEPVGDG